MIDSALILRATDEHRVFWCVCLHFGFEGDALYHSTDTGSLILSGFLGTYEDTIQDDTV